MLKHYSQFSLTGMAFVLSVSRSGFHRWFKHRNKPDQRAESQAARDLLIWEAFHRTKGRSGARCIQKDLEENGFPCCLKTIQASMKRQELIPKAAGKFKVTTDSKH